MNTKRLIVGLLLLLAVGVAAALGIGVSAAAAPQDGVAPALEEFVPSEELPADSAVSFPVDI
jgi:hypothetical protein